MLWVQRVIEGADFEDWRDHARESILDVNDGIVSAAGIAEGFASAGAPTRTLVFAGAAVVLAGGIAAACARYSEKRTAYERNRSRLEAEKPASRQIPMASLKSSLTFTNPRASAAAWRGRSPRNSPRSTRWPLMPT